MALDTLRATGACAPYAHHLTPRTAANLHVLAVRRLLSVLPNSAAAGGGIVCADRDASPVAMLIALTKVTVPNTSHKLPWLLDILETTVFLAALQFVTYRGKAATAESKTEPDLSILTRCRRFARSTRQLIRAECLAPDLSSGPALSARRGATGTI